MLYSLLHLTGHAISLNDLKQFRQWDSKTPGHPEHNIARGIETTTGPLGQGISQSVGLALGEAITAARVNAGEEKLIDHYTYVIASDGDLMEGVSHEAASFAGAQQLGKLIVLYDDNGICIDGKVSITCIDDAPKRFESYGWHTQTVDGYDMEAIESAILAAQKEQSRPSIICCKTKIGYMSPGEGTNKVHGSPLGAEGVAKTKAALGLDPEKQFQVDDDVRRRFAEIGARNTKLREEWDAAASKFFAAHPEGAELVRMLRSGDVPAGWESAVPTFEQGTKMATRVASSKVLDALEANPTLKQALVGGSADLTPSNNTKAAGAVDVFPPEHNGSYVHYGIREHAMGQIMNGLTIYGYRAFGGTFAVFSDYMRPAVRAAAMMGLPVVYVWTHDSIGLGEDGPTHQPIEHFVALRCIPNLVTFRPCDANEVAGAWRYALEQRRARKPWACEGADLKTDADAGMLYAPVALLLTRQNLTVVSPPASEGKVARGAYVLRDAVGGKRADVILMATGSEVELAVNAAAALQGEGVAARVVSMPSWELFDQQSQEYRESVLTPGVPRLGIEAGSTFAWPRYYDGCKGAAIGLDRYGASAPYATLFKNFGFTVEHVCEVAKKLIGK